MSKASHRILKTLGAFNKTLHLPKSSLPPVAPRAAPAIAQLLKRSTDDLYTRQLARRPEHKTFTLHDGPPYANGSLHMGHALNKILKDIINRVRLQSGHRIHYVPGWDCHGLPIELKALEALGGADKTRSMTALEIRTAARELALSTVETQREAFRSWAVMGDWEHPYRTLDTDYEVRQLGVFREMAARGLVYRRFKPVFWSPSSRTALAEAELEYNDAHKSRSAFVRFGLGELRGHDGVGMLVWTTTPWTLPANRAAAVGREMEYVLVQTGRHGKLLVGKARVGYVAEMLKEELEVVEEGILGGELEGRGYTHPLFPERGASPILHADFVSEESGTGVVHIAPGHGMEDYLLCLESAHDLPPFSPVDDAGCFTEDAGFPELVGKEVLYGGNKLVLQLLEDRGALVHSHNYKHKYPYDWRSKTPIIVRSTAQWFADVSGIKDPAVKALDAVAFHPDTGRSRLAAFVAGRNEWCISRQRSWGVPIPAVYTPDGDPLLTPDSVSHIIGVLSTLGTNAWFDPSIPTSRFLPDSLPNRDSYTRKHETMDVWFDSGTSWTLLPPRAPDSPTLYLEGSDQARGWFQSSLLTSLATTGRPPFTHLVTHGFVLDAKGKKMSKSLGNITEPNAATFPGGADHLRLWAAASDYTKDVTVGKTSIEHAQRILHKARVTLRFLEAGAHGHDPAAPARPNRVDRLALAFLAELEHSVRAAYDSLNFARAVKELNLFNTTTLSALYLDVTKDRMYTLPASDPRRVAAQAVFRALLESLTALWAPVTPLLATEARGEAVDEFVVRGVQDAELLRGWERVERVRAAVRKALERAKRSGNAMAWGLECRVLVRADVAGWEKAELEEVLVCAEVEMGEWAEGLKEGEWEEVEAVEGGGEVRVRKARGKKCPRCWVHRSESVEEVCGQCEKALETMEMEGAVKAE